MTDCPYRVLDQNPEHTVALVEGSTGDALRIGTITLQNLQEFVSRLQGLAQPDDEIDLYLDYVTFIGKPVVKDEPRMALVLGRIVEDDSDGDVQA